MKRGRDRTPLHHRHIGVKNWTKGGNSGNGLHGLKIWQKQKGQYFFRLALKINAREGQETKKLIIVPWFASGGSCLLRCWKWKTNPRKPCRRVWRVLVYFHSFQDSCFCWEIAKLMACIYTCGINTHNGSVWLLTKCSVLTSWRGLSLTSEPLFVHVTVASALTSAPASKSSPTISTWRRSTAKCRAVFFSSPDVYAFRSAPAPTKIWHTPRSPVMVAKCRAVAPWRLVQPLPPRLPKSCPQMSNIPLYTRFLLMLIFTWKWGIRKKRKTPVILNFE